MFSTDGRAVLLLMHFHFCSTLLNFVGDAQGSKVERKCKQCIGESALFHISATAARLNKTSASLLVNFSLSFCCCLQNIYMDLHEFSPGDKVLALCPLVSLSSWAKFLILIQLSNMFRSELLDFNLWLLETNEAFFMVIC